MSPIGLVNNVARFAVFGVLKGEINRNGQSGLAGNITGHGGFFGRELSFNDKEVDASFDQRIYNARMRISHLGVGYTKSRIAGV